LPTTANKVLGSTSTTTVTLSSAAGAKDILNFYYDGTNCYWNLGQGYGTAATVASTNLASSVSGTLAVANGGTGSTTQNFVDLTTNQSIAGNKNFNGTIGIGITSNYGSSKLHVAGNGLVVWGGTGTLLDASGNNHGHNENVALTVDGKANNDILQLRNTSPNTLLVVDKDGNMGIGNTTPSQKLEVTGNIKTSGTLTAGNVTYPNNHNSTAGQVLTVNASGTASWSSPSSGVAGSGTINSIPKFSTTTALSNSSISEDGTGLYIGKPSGGGGVYTGLNGDNNTRLFVNGGRELESIKMSFPGDPYNNELSFNWYGSAWRMRTERSSADITDLSFWRTVGGTTTEAIRIKASGNFGIGVDPSQKLDVAGNVKFSGALMPNNSAGTSGQVLTSAGANAVPTWTTPVSSAASITGTLAVANGGTGTTNGSITGTTALSFAAGGSNQNVSILPSGTGSVGIGTNSPNSSAILDASSTTKGFLPPRMTYAQKIAISSPPQGLMIYCTNCGTNGEPEYFNGVSWVNMSGGPAASVPITLGGTYGGGIVFYIFQSGEPGYVAGETHGLIAATSDTQGYRVFGCRGWPAGTSTALGTGAANTTTLLGCSDTFFAAKLARAVRDGGYTDWYLPSKDELNKLYLNRNSVGNFIDGSYWSSSESSNAAYAWYQIFSDGSQSEDDKNAQKGIRAIRSF